MALKVVDRFTTQHGSWDVNPSKPYGIDQAHRDKYEAGRLIPGAGADHHIFVHAPFANIVHFSTDGMRFFAGELKGGWWNFPMFNGKHEIARDITLPGGEHVSTFLVVEDVAGDAVDVGSHPTPSGQYEEVVLRTMLNGIQIKEEVLWSGKL
jgi:hypothetical protein